VFPLYPLFASDHNKCKIHSLVSDHGIFYCICFFEICKNASITSALLLLMFSTKYESVTHLIIDLFKVLVLFYFLLHPDSCVSSLIPINVFGCGYVLVLCVICVFLSVLIYKGDTILWLLFYFLFLPTSPYISKIKQLLYAHLVRVPNSCPPLWESIALDLSGLETDILVACISCRHTHSQTYSQY
jgi:hypothetical protein